MPVMAEMTIDMLPHGQRGNHSGIIPWWYFVEVLTMFVMLMQLDLMYVEGVYLGGSQTFNYRARLRRPTLSSSTVLVGP